MLNQFNQAMSKMETQRDQPTIPRNDNFMIDHFMRQLAPVFMGNLDPVKAEEWLSSLEKIFDVLQCDNLEKTRLAIYRLVGEANKWWEEIKG